MMIALDELFGFSLSTVLVFSAEGCFIYCSSSPYLLIFALQRTWSMKTSGNASTRNYDSHEQRVALLMVTETAIPFRLLVIRVQTCGARLHADDCYLHIFDQILILHSSDSQADKQSDSRKVSESFVTW